MTIESLTRTDTSEGLPVDVIREQAGLPPLAEGLREIGGWVPESDPLTAEQPVAREDTGSPLFDEISAQYDLKPDWWWEERFQHITDELRDEIETENLEQLSADIADAVVQIEHDDDLSITIHGVNPASIELSDVDFAPHEVAAMPDPGYVARPVAGWQYSEEHGGWYREDETHTLAIGTQAAHLTYEYMRAHMWGNARETPDGWYYEDDEDTQKIEDAFQRGEKGTTAPPVYEPESRWRRFWGAVGDFIKSFR